MSVHDFMTLARASTCCVITAWLAAALVGCECDTPPVGHHDGGLDASFDSGLDASFDSGLDAATTPDCGVMTSVVDERIACGAELCEVPSEACCRRPDALCGEAATCVDRASPPRDCAAIIECTGRPGQCPAGSWCCNDSGPGFVGLRCVADASSCVALVCRPGDAESCPPERPACRMLSLEGAFECVAEPDAGTEG